MHQDCWVGGKIRSVIDMRLDSSGCFPKFCLVFVSNCHLTEVGMLSSSAGGLNSSGDFEFIAETLGFKGTLT